MEPQNVIDRELIPASTERTDSLFKGAPGQLEAQPEPGPAPRATVWPEKIFLYFILTATLVFLVVATPTRAIGPTEAVSPADRSFLHEDLPAPTK